MIRYLPLCLLVICGSMLGCAESGIRAQAPGSDNPLRSKVQSEGQYGLYHVTQFNSVGQPSQYTLITSYHLQKGDEIGFRWVSDKNAVYEPNAALSLTAFAGDQTINLGPIKSINEKYYWANTSHWSDHWATEPINGTLKTVTLQ